ncbi:MAG: J domain-containing protein [Spirochaetales bacterium]|nr:J domain-containing protein [Spirochaetales bacterium]
MKPDYYEILGVSRDATADQIKKAFREQAFKFHPDRNPANAAAEERFKSLNEAYSVLGDPAKKNQYDSGAYNDNPYNQAGPAYQDPFGQFTWRYYNPFEEAEQWKRQAGPQDPATRREAVELLVKSILTFLVGVLLLRLSFVFGIFGLIICLTAIGRGFVNSLKALRLLFSLRQ